MEWRPFDHDDSATWPEVGRDCIVTVAVPKARMTETASMDSDGFWTYDDGDMIEAWNSVRVVAWMYWPEPWGGEVE